MRTAITASGSEAVSKRLVRASAARASRSEVLVHMGFGASTHRVETKARAAMTCAPNIRRVYARRKAQRAVRSRDKTASSSTTFRAEKDFGVRPEAVAEVRFLRTVPAAATTIVARALRSATSMRDDVARSSSLWRTSRAERASQRALALGLPSNALLDVVSVRATGASALTALKMFSPPATTASSVIFLRSVFLSSKLGRPARTTRTVRVASATAGVTAATASVDVSHAYAAPSTRVGTCSTDTSTRARGYGSKVMRPRVGGSMGSWCAK